MTYQTGAIDVIGPIWWPAGSIAATTYNVHGHDIDNMREDDGTITRESVADWLDSHSGDFQQVNDFRAVIAGEVYDWTDDASADVFADCMWGGEDDD